jgi:hypothetical protein
MNLDFEWDDIKVAENVRNHGVSFAQAAQAFRDPFGVEWIDLRGRLRRRTNNPARHDRQSGTDRGVYGAGGTDQNHLSPPGDKK